MFLHMSVILSTQRGVTSNAPSDRLHPLPPHPLRCHTAPQMSHPLKWHTPLRCHIPLRCHSPISHPLESHTLPPDVTTPSDVTPLRCHTPQMLHLQCHFPLRVTHTPLRCHNPLRCHIPQMSHSLDCKTPNVTPPSDVTHLLRCHTHPSLRCHTHGRQSTRKYGQCAADTHHTGMHTCSKVHLITLNTFHNL